jgi:hypothetical protein
MGLPIPFSRVPKLAPAPNKYTTLLIIKNCCLHIQLIFYITNYSPFVLTAETLLHDGRCSATVGSCGTRGANIKKKMKPTKLPRVRVHSLFRGGVGR